MSYGILGPQVTFAILFLAFHGNICFFNSSLKQNINFLNIFCLIVILVYKNMSCGLGVIKLVETIQNIVKQA